MAKKKSCNAYEEARKQRLQENLKRFQDLGIQKISESLSMSTHTDKTVKTHSKPKLKLGLEVSELRRSSRARNPVLSYYEDVRPEEFRLFRRSRARKGSSSPIKLASYEERRHALETAEKLQTNLKSGHPSFIKSMVVSHVSSCFWLGLPKKFCDDHLPKNELKMVLEDEDGLEFDTIYIGRRQGLSGGWRGFAMEHKLDDGDALVFELTKSTRFKVHIIKAATEDKILRKGAKLSAKK